MSKLQCPDKSGLAITEADCYVTPNDLNVA
jgi:hypothetical protein